MSSDINIIRDKEKIDHNLNELFSQGFCFLPQFKCDDIVANEIHNLISERKKTYTTDTEIHKRYLAKSGIMDTLLPKLVENSSRFVKKKVDLKDVYMVTRIVHQSEESESYRAHFDSHLFTLVTPVFIPKNTKSENKGQLILFNKIRNEPKNEFSNFFGKLKYKRFASKTGIEDLSKEFSPLEFDFSDMSPVLFMGRQSYHCNRPFDNNSNEYRITFLTHFFDPSPPWGIGNINRMIRLR